MLPIPKEINIVISVVLTIVVIISGASYVLFSNLFNGEEGDNGDFQITGNTNIFYPKNNSKVSGVIEIVTYVETCNCTGYTKLYVDGIFISNGTRKTGEEMICIDNKWMEVFYNTWDTTQFDNGPHKIVIIGKHDQYQDEITLIVRN